MINTKIGSITDEEKSSKENFIKKMLVNNQLYCTTVYYAMPCYAMQCCAVLCYAILLLWHAGFEINFCAQLSLGHHKSCFGCPPPIFWLSHIFSVSRPHPHPPNNVQLESWMIRACKFALLCSRRLPMGHPLHTLWLSSFGLSGATGQPLTSNSGMVPDNYLNVVVLTWFSTNMFLMETVW